MAAYTDQRPYGPNDLIRIYLSCLDHMESSTRMYEEAMKAHLKSRANLERASRRGTGAVAHKSPESFWLQYFSEDKSSKV